MKLKQLQAVISLMLLSIVADAQTNTFPSSGDVGIGTTSPNTKLNVRSNGIASGSLKYQIGIISDVDYNANPVAGIGFLTKHNTGSGQIAEYAGITGGKENATVDNSAGYLAMHTNYTGGSLSERMRITSNGNIGIGTPAPDTRLSIRGVETASGSLKYQCAIVSDVAYNLNPVSGIAFFSKYNTGDAQISQYSGITGGKENNTIDNSAGYLAFHTNYATGSPSERMRISSNGNVGIGILNPGEKLSVNGNIKAQKVIITQTGWPDYVFHPSYKLTPLSEVVQFIKQHQRLPDVPSAQEVEQNGLNIGDNQALLLKKIEELTLYVIDIKRENADMKDEIRSQSQEIKEFKNRMSKR